MPTILRIGPYRFYFYGHEPNEPPHTHVDRDDLSAKFWLLTVGLAKNIGFSSKELRQLQKLVIEHQGKSRRLGMGILAPTADERVTDVKVTRDMLTVSLCDGRKISVPLAWFPRLLDATAAQRNHWVVAGGGYGVHWPDLDEDVSTEGLLRGAPAPRPAVNPRASDSTRPAKKVR